MSALHTLRLKYQPVLPKHIVDIDNVIVEDGPKTQSKVDQKELSELFKHTYGLPAAKLAAGKSEEIHRKMRCGFILSGGPAAGGHNVVAGLYDGLMKGNKENKLFGFKCGAGGILKNEYIEITSELIDKYRNMGGFDIVGSGRTKIETDEQFATAFKNISALELDALIVVGGDDSNTNCALLAEYFAAKNSKCVFVGVPKTIDGDLKNEYIEVSFGFDTACKTYSESIGNIERDAISSRKYWHFIKLMGRSASHIALEASLQAQPTYAIVSEEVEAKKMTVNQIANKLTDLVVKRSQDGLNFGVVLIPEGLLEFIPEVKVLIEQLNDLLAHKKEEYAKLTEFAQQKAFVIEHIPKEMGEVFSGLPDNIAKQLLLDRDPHGNVNVSAIETETFVSGIIKNELKRRGSKVPFTPVHHFFGYEGRCAFPTNFDATYCYALGYTSFILAAYKKTGQICCISGLKGPSTEWICGGVPLTVMMNMEQRNGSLKPVIQKALVELNGKPFKYYESKREAWALAEDYAFPGAVQYYGPAEVSDQPPKTLLLEQN
ncbi:Pyrophosphate--fructose 6-phosphate 1-phosphotransferase subunit beta, putative [Entamoeba invadens IP1]|uniref:Pyrophosphate--fructose 6-phosphate 1-phosphotransferase n=2 Tax=Entamoeba invadens TaxID=33085 RepID=A0A0A1U963_ENTIV|nr:Pyrophosphate--fructose 6-phosphate 1-phosphotransferase subunit beta, putative [Entamoeba invadens IP1]ELP88513.1 Pyrophosphate--fructose 6-phosphate 1-phosphotransferase subunit beta, putative [Entamoeba invadens IP1]BAN42538.1 pyrophosphate--fructose 6-phosphate 1-phosphotransferase subunit beta, putative [Entamoeba invadens]|eukprot:XP_004255284.1 Pyrophosphate--fructose 6-phosphate 1-phosphotransferase subunit beta, putative [Entamoeba invadens IP1]